MNLARFWVQKLTRRAIQLAASQLYVNPPTDLSHSILVAGTARSGSTWLGDMIAQQIPCRILFEPFNNRRVRQYRDFQYFQYLRPGESALDFKRFARKVFSGEIRSRWIDRQNERIFSEYRLVKEIRINLALKWLQVNFPQVPMLLLLRHPCAVVQSRMALGWATDGDIEPFLKQDDLVSDHLTGYLELIRAARSEEEKHAIIWCVSYLVPLRQFQSGEIPIVFYEDLCIQPETELARIFAAMHLEQRYKKAAQSARPSQTTMAASAVVNGSDRVMQWQKKLKSAQITAILQVVKSFNLDYLYGESPLPLKRTV